MSGGPRTTDHLRLLAVEEAEAPTDAPDVVAAPRAWIRRRTPWLVAATVLAVLALVGAQAALDLRDRHRLADLAAVPGVLQPLPERVHAVWRWTPVTSASLVAGDTASRWAIGARYQQGVVELRGTDPDTGAVLWTTPFPIDDALPVEDRGGFPSVWVRCATVSPAPRAQTVCGADLAGPGEVVGVPLLVLDPTDGAVLARQVLTAGSLWTVDGGHLLVARPVADDVTRTHWEVRATDPATGAGVWDSSTRPVRLTGPVRVGGVTIDPEAALTNDGDRILLAAGGHAWLWSPDGTGHRDVQISPEGVTRLGRGGTLVWTPFQSLGLSVGVLVTDGGRQVPIDGVQAELTIDDGSAPGVVLLRTRAEGAALVARDAGTGRELWRAGGSVGPVIVLDGSVVAAGPSAVVARDARTGEVRWRTRLDAEPVYLGADPRHVVVLTGDEKLRVLDLGDGHVAGTADVGALFGADPGDLDHAEEVGGRLLVMFRSGSAMAIG
ncbi:PQQ-binding-like beta-propeller repeat protein [Cellulomonas sp. URHE0023]|uniref:outer membrane protein assembly factor BamB family protein n=1 Tax=Cellulomonas sp. URHE0023 TaxID=1380354 RepID=UPI0004843473|nr:PQQ-binding-like beta-propeller repeat protein [Cellulomonas sp. URHE0023]